jgi:hypothetical protein
MARKHDYKPTQPAPATGCYTLAIAVANPHPDGRGRGTEHLIAWPAGTTVVVCAPFDPDSPPEIMLREYRVTRWTAPQIWDAIIPALVPAEMTLRGWQHIHHVSDYELRGCIEQLLDEGMTFAELAALKARADARHET